MTTYDTFKADTDWTKCPFCQDSDGMTASETSYAGGEYVETWYCETCDNEWHEVYLRSHRSEI